VPSQLSPARYEEELRELTTGTGKHLLRTLGISLTDLGLRTIAEDEDTRVEWIGIIADIAHAVGKDLGKIRLLAAEVSETPTLLNDIEAHRERREIVRRNRTTGELVEQLLEESLEQHGIAVCRTGVGSDFEVAQDYLIDDEEMMIALGGERRSWLLEVKATTQDVVRMTVAQARKAIENLDEFVLCVVRLDDTTAVSQETLKERCYFMNDIGQRIQPIWNNYTRFRKNQGRGSRFNR
jgi:hypothetical protein